MPFPTWVDFESAEHSAAVMARRLSGSSESWGALLANAQAVLASRTDAPDSESITSYEFGAWRDLVAAARILDLAATRHGLKESDDRQTAAILAACTFGMSGTFVSSTAVIRGHDLLESNLTHGELTALAISSPILSREVFSRLPEGSKYRACLENVAAFLATGKEELFNTATAALLQATLEEPGSWEGYLLRLGRLSLAHANRLATAKVLGVNRPVFPREYLSRLVDDSPVLLPPQYEAITEHGVLSQDRNLLVTLPTGTGKTLLGELALLSSLGRESGLACYIAPYVALGRQVAEKISRHTPDDVRVHRLFGGYREPDPLDPENRIEVLVATPERFDALLRLRGDLLPLIRCVVFDEAHMIGNGQRGVRLEGMLTRLKLAASRKEQVPRFVLLSAVLSNADILAHWLNIAPENVIRGTWRPSAKRMLRWTEDGMLRLHAGDDPLRKLPSQVLGETRLPWPNVGFYLASHFGGIKRQEPRALDNVALLAEFQYEQYEQPVLCICSTRAKTRQLAAQIAERFQSFEPLPQPVKTVTDLIGKKYPYLRPLNESLQRGVAYHNSSLPHEIREGIERAVEARELKVVAATTTLAEGVDLPFRVTILADWLTFDGEKSRPMENLLFKNIAGRCGRAGQFTEGDTVIFDNPVGDAKLTSPVQRPVLQNDIFFPEAQPILASAVSRLDRPTAISAIGSQILAAISENPDMEDLATSFRDTSFANRTVGAEVAAQRISMAFDDILDASEGEPLAVVASPIRLTHFGAAANSGGLSPATAKKLRKALSAFSEVGSSRDDFIAIGVELLISLAGVAEQGNPDLRKAAANPKSRPVVKLDELGLVLRLWLAGASYETIFAALPTNRRSKRQPELETWLRGVSQDGAWTDQFAKFHEFMSNCVEFFLPWILRASRPLAEIDGQPDRPWGEWARYVELGLDSTWAVRLFEGGAVAERSAAQQIGQGLDELLSDGVPTFEQIQQTLTKTFGDDRRSIEWLTSWLRQRVSIA